MLQRQVDGDVPLSRYHPVPKIPKYLFMSTNSYFDDLVFIITIITINNIIIIVIFIVIVTLIVNVIAIIVNVTVIIVIITTRTPN